ncbi:MAG: hypothetical protein QGH83_13960 [Candidatus Pacebacteria bacterium]|jgi:uncharacterized Zn-binding protein involved in type VI secretion|nr:hypothetical protein [Candidatus Paceibacterota bacterium]|tara:strand:+ start:639 stop:929 length:291 start_codon:yes stop_codon:yes gene_type:complete
MGMPCSITGDMSMGHTGFSPSPIIPTTVTVLVMNVPPHVTGDQIVIHILGNSAHPGAIGPASTSVMAQSKPVARMMDKGACGAMVMGSAATVIVGG